MAKELNKKENKIASTLFNLVIMCCIGDDLFLGKLLCQVDQLLLLFAQLEVETTSGRRSMGQTPLQGQWRDSGKQVDVSTKARHLLFEVGVQKTNFNLSLKMMSNNKRSMFLLLM